MHVRDIDISAIEVGTRLRALDPAWVNVLAVDIYGDANRPANGQTTPIHVVERGAGFVLIDGARRIAAVAQRGKTTIRAVVAPGEALTEPGYVEFGQIRANLMRGELTTLDHALYAAAWRETYLRTTAVRKRGRPTNAERDQKNVAQRADKSRPGIVANNDDNADLFIQSLSQAMQDALGVSGRTLRRLLKIASIGSGRAARLVGKPIANNRDELLRLAEQAPERQDAIIDLLVSQDPEVKTVDEAIARLDRSPVKRGPGPVERVLGPLSRLTIEEREAVFELNREAIETWLAKTGALAVRRTARTGR